MSDGSQSSSLSALEARLSALSGRIIARFPERARELRELAEEPEEERQREGIRRAAHRLKGIAGSVGEEDLGLEAGRLEAEAHSLPKARLRERAEALAARLSAVAEARAVLASPSPSPSPSPAPPKREALVGSVLLVDDDEASRRLLAVSLERMAGASVCALQSGEEALPHLERERFDLLVFDGCLPGLDGRALWKHARALPGGRGQVPILMLSAASREELGWEEVQGPRTLWLAKPLRPSLLIEALRSFLGRASER